MTPLGVEVRLSGKAMGTFKVMSVAASAGVAASSKAAMEALANNFMDILPEMAAIFRAFGGGSSTPRDCSKARQTNSTHRVPAGILPSKPMIASVGLKNLTSLIGNAMSGEETLSAL